MNSCHVKYLFLLKEDINADKPEELVKVDIPESKGISSSKEDTNDNPKKSLTTYQIVHPKDFLRKRVKNKEETLTTHEPESTTKTTSFINLDEEKDEQIFHPKESHQEHLNNKETDEPLTDKPAETSTIQYIEEEESEG